MHLCPRPLEPGTKVEGVLDYPARFLRMQQHSGEHMVSGVIHRRYGFHNTGFHMGADCITIDFDGVIPPEDLPEIEAEVNGFVWQNLNVRCWVPSPEGAGNHPLPYQAGAALAGADCGDSRSGHLRLLRPHPCDPDRGDRPGEAVQRHSVPGRHPDGDGLRQPGAGDSQRGL